MKKILALGSILGFLALTGTAQMVDTTYTIPPPMIAVDDTLTYTIYHNDSVIGFRFWHPDYENAFWSEQALVERIIDMYNLNSTSGDSAFILSIADMFKRQRLHGNRIFKDETVQQTTLDPHYALSTVDHYSLQGKHFANKLANTYRLLCAELGVPETQIRIVKMNTYYGIEYLATNGHWTFLDPDAGTNVLQPRKNGTLVSFHADVIGTLFNVIGIVALDYTGTTWNNAFYQPWECREQYYSMLHWQYGMDSTVTYLSPDYGTDNRDMLYKLPAGATMQFQMINDKILFSTDYWTTDSLLYSQWNSSFPDTTTICNAVGHLGMYNGYDSAYVVQHWFADPNSIILGSGPHHILGPKDSELFMSVTLEPGTYTIDSLQVPNLLRSIEPKHTGIAFSVNGVTYTDSAFFYSYLSTEIVPYGTPPPISASDIQYGITSVTVPDSLESLTLTFYYNPELFKFWEENWKIIRYLDPTLSINESVAESRVSVYPNPTTGIVNISQTGDDITLTSIAGSVIGHYTSTSQIDMSQLSPGIYCMTIRQGKEIFVKKIIKQ